MSLPISLEPHLSTAPAPPPGLAAVATLVSRPAPGDAPVAARPPITRFGAFRFDSGNRSLWRGSERVHLSHKAAALLQCLLDHDGWVGKDVILGTVWPSVHVQPENIKVLVRELRVALGDDSKRPQFIDCEPKRGYAFVGEAIDGASPAADQSVAPSSLTFVNRWAELAALTEDFAAAIAGEARFAVVSGPPGIGKSALCEAFLRTARALQPIRHAASNCAAADANRPMGPLLDLVRRLWCAEPDVQALLESHAPAWLAALTGVRHPASSEDLALMRSQLYGLLERLASDRPVVIVIEALERADPATLEALSGLAQSSPARLLVIGTGSGTSTSTTPGVFLAGARQLVIPPLDETQVGRYLNARFGHGCLSRLAPALCGATGGIPALMVAATDALVARGLVRLTTTGWQLSKSVSTVAATLTDANHTAFAGRITIDRLVFGQAS